MAKLSGTDDKSSSHNENFMADDTDSAEFEVNEGNNEETPPPRVNPKDPAIRRKIEDRLERKRLRDELGIYDEDDWTDI